MCVSTHLPWTRLGSQKLLAPEHWGSMSLARQSWPCSIAMGRYVHQLSSHPFQPGRLPSALWVLVPALPPTALCELKLVIQPLQGLASVAEGPKLNIH